MEYRLEAEGGAMLGRAGRVGLAIEVILEVDEVEECFARVGTIDFRGVGRPEEGRVEVTEGGFAILVGVGIFRRGLEVNTSVAGRFSLALAWIGGPSKPSEPLLDDIADDKDEVAEDIDNLEAVNDEGRAGENESRERSKDSSSEDE